ncbi:hypothetical protein EW145_g5047 [Phellinidium pouzarii]|uniref:DUF6593 domain-containing protein n=1 Tax=Phellinidium pouzarii TaxID=167371 RepID=A0A4V3XCA8_9AGAM|nr:hypothetical protein EW145_g5047 [Phellinidium pouzarii]
MADETMYGRVVKDVAHIAAPLEQSADGINFIRPPDPDITSERVVHFSKARGQALLQSDVLNHNERIVYQFDSKGTKNMRMRDANGTVIASIDSGKIDYGDNKNIKANKFIDRDNSGNTGAVLTHNGQTYEWVQELLYSVLRTTPGAERVAVIHNCRGNPAVEMLPEGLKVPGLQAHIVFATVLIESDVMKGNGVISRISCSIIPKKKRVSQG